MDFGSRCLLVSREKVPLCDFDFEPVADQAGMGDFPVLGAPEPGTLPSFQERG